MNLLPAILISQVTLLQERKQISHSVPPQGPGCSPSCPELELFDHVVSFWLDLHLQLWGYSSCGWSSQLHIPPTHTQAHTHTHTHRHTCTHAHTHTHTHITHHTPTHTHQVIQVFLSAVSGVVLAERPHQDHGHQAHQEDDHHERVED